MNTLKVKNLARQGAAALELMYDFQRLNLLKQEN
jgi:hypothetical protein